MQWVSKQRALDVHLFLLSSCSALWCVLCSVLILIAGDLIRQRVDAIVNPTNPVLEHKGGASKCIAEAAGKDLLKSCSVHVQKHGHLVVSEPMHTTSGKLSPNINYVIHVVGPSFDRLQSGANLEAVYEPLTATFFNCLDYADRQMKLGSVAMPAISSGNVLAVLCCHLVLIELHCL